MEHNLLEVEAFRSYKDLRQDINNIKIWLLKYKKTIHVNLKEYNKIIVWLFLCRKQYGGQSIEIKVVGNKYCSIELP